MSYTGLIEINIICIAVLLITLLQFKESVLRHLEERILGFTIIDTIIYISGAIYSFFCLRFIFPSV